MIIRFFAGFVTIVFGLFEVFGVVFDHRFLSKFTFQKSETSTSNEYDLVKYTEKGREPTFPLLPLEMSNSSQKKRVLLLCSKLKARSLHLTRPSAILMWGEILKQSLSLQPHLPGITKKKKKKHIKMG